MARTVSVSSAGAVTRARPRDTAAWRAVVAIVVVALAAGVAGWFLGRGTVRAAPTVDTSTPTVITVAPEARLLTDSLTLRGQLQPPGAEPVMSGGGGRLTALLASDAIVGNGSLLGALDGEPMIALQGEHPYWRDMSIGARGADVAQLNHQLLALGHDPGTSEDRFTKGTLAAWNGLRVAVGYPGTAESVGPAGAVVVPFSEPVPVGEISAAVGDFVAPGATLFTVVTGEALVRVTVPAESTALLEVGAEVVLDGGVPGMIVALETTDGGTVALVAPQDPLTSPAPLVRVVLAESGAGDLVLPTLAVRTRADGSTYVVVSGSQTDREVDVEVTLVVGGEAAVMGDLTVQDRVVLGGPPVAAGSADAPATEPARTGEPDSTATGDTEP